MAQNDFCKEAGVWPVNSDGDLVLSVAPGDTTVAGWVPANALPQDVRTGRIRAVFGPAATESATFGNDLTFYVKEGDNVKFTSTSATGTITKYKADGSVDFTQSVTSGQVFSYGPYAGTQKFTVSGVVGGSISANSEATVVSLAVPAPAASVRAIALGDSNFAAMYNVTSTDNETQSWCMLSWVAPLSMQRYQIVQNLAASGNGVWVNGAFTKNLEWQIDQALISPYYATANTVLIMIGTNDYLVDSPDNTALKLQAQLPRLKGKRIRLCTILPKGIDPNNSFNRNTEFAWDGVTRAWEWNLRYNKLLAIIAANSGGTVKLVDVHGAVSDPTSATDFAATTVVYDGTHTTNLTSLLCARKIIAADAADLTSQIDWVTSNADYRGLNGASSQAKSMNLVQNPLFVTQSGGIPVNWVTAASQNSGSGATATPSQIDSPTGVGKALQVVAAAGSVSGSGSNVKSNTGQSPSPASMVVVGDQVYAQAYIKVSPGASKLRQIRMRTLIVTSGVSRFATDLQDSAALGAYNRCVELPEFEVLLRTPISTIGSTLPSNVFPEIYQTFTEATTGSVTYAVAHGSLTAIPAAFAA